MIDDKIVRETETLNQWNNQEELENREKTISIFNSNEGPTLTFKINRNTMILCTGDQLEWLFNLERLEHLEKIIKEAKEKILENANQTGDAIEDLLKQKGL